jgi:HEAT repeat protein
MEWKPFVLAASILLVAAHAFAQDEPKQRIKVIHDLGKGGSESIPRIEPYLSDPDVNVRIEAVKAIVDIGTQRSLDALIKATSDNDAEIQIRATDGLVNFYLPGYIKTGMTASIRRVGGAIKGRFTDNNDQVIDDYVEPRPEVVVAIGRLVSGGASLEVRANAARAAGILRGRDAVPDLVKALRTKDTQVILESLVALQKIRDAGAGPQVTFLLHDLDEKVQITTIETIGLLQDHGAVNDLRDVLDRSRKIKVRRAALTALAQMPAGDLHATFLNFLADKDEGLREAAAEGIGRISDPADRSKMQDAFEKETKAGPRLSDAFAVVLLGSRDMSDFAPLRYLVNQLNSAVYRGVAKAYLIEVARDGDVRKSLYTALQQPVVTKDEKTGLAQILGRSGGPDSVAVLDTLSKDPDRDVAAEGLRALRSVNARGQ